MRGIAKEKLLLVQNLKDAGCDERTIEKYFQLQEEGRKEDQFRLLSIHRTILLEQLHVS